MARTMAAMSATDPLAIVTALGAARATSAASVDAELRSSRDRDTA